MQLLSKPTEPREPRCVVPMDGYVHKFRLEAREEAAAERRVHVETTPTVSVGSLLGKLALSALALLGIAAAGSHVLI